MAYLILIKELICLVVGMEVDERLEDIDLPKAERLRKVTVPPLLRLPHVGHCRRALPQLVVIVHDVEVPAVLRVYVRLRRLVRTLAPPSS